MHWISNTRPWAGCHCLTDGWSGFCFAPSRFPWQALFTEGRRKRWAIQPMLLYILTYLCNLQARIHYNNPAPSRLGPPDTVCTKSSTHPIVGIMIVINHQNRVARRISYLTNDSLFILGRKMGLSLPCSQTISLLSIAPKSCFPNTHPFNHSEDIQK